MRQQTAFLMRDEEAFAKSHARLNQFNHYAGEPLKMLNVKTGRVFRFHMQVDDYGPRDRRFKKVGTAPTQDTLLLTYNKGEGQTAPSHHCAKDLADKHFDLTRRQWLNVLRLIDRSGGSIEDAQGKNVDLKDKDAKAALVDFLTQDEAVIAERNRIIAIKRRENAGLGCGG